MMEELGGNLAAVVTATPLDSRNANHFECPLCVDVFQQFSQLQEHLLSTHPRRQLIMKLITERYGISKCDTETLIGPSVDHQHTQDPPAGCEQTAGKLLQVVLGTGLSTNVFKVPHQLLRKAVALPQITDGQCEKRCQDIKRAQKISQSEESSTWESYLTFCLSNSESSEPANKDQ